MNIIKYAKRMSKITGKSERKIIRDFYRYKSIKKRKYRNEISELKKKMSNVKKSLNMLNEIETLNNE